MNLMFHLHRARLYCKTNFAFENLISAAFSTKRILSSLEIANEDIPFSRKYFPKARFFNKIFNIYFGLLSPSSPLRFQQYHLLDFSQLHRRRHRQNLQRKNSRREEEMQTFSENSLVGGEGRISGKNKKFIRKILGRFAVLRESWDPKHIHCRYNIICYIEGTSKRKLLCKYPSYKGTLLLLSSAGVRDGKKCS